MSFYFQKNDKWKTRIKEFSNSRNGVGYFLYQSKDANHETWTTGAVGTAEFFGLTEKEIEWANT